MLLHVVAWWRYDIEIFQQNWPFAGDYKHKGLAMRFYHIFCDGNLSTLLNK